MLAGIGIDQMAPVALSGPTFVAPEVNVTFEPAVVAVVALLLSVTFMSASATGLPAPAVLFAGFESAVRLETLLVFEIRYPDGVPSTACTTSEKICVPSLCAS